jgi:hypothetical protein
LCVHRRQGGGQAEGRSWARIARRHRSRCGAAVTELSYARKWLLKIFAERRWGHGSQLRTQLAVVPDFRPRVLAAGVKACKDIQVLAHVGKEDARSD